MKKGFTIVEIIISISLVIIVGISATFFIISKKSNNELEKITKEILEAANAYVKTEKDKNGNIYANKIVSGAKGLKVPITNLVDSGYIKEEQANKVYELNLELEDNQDYYILFAESTSNYCDNGSYISLASWMLKGDNIYLCDKSEDKKFDTNTIYGYLQSLPYITNCNNLTNGGFLCLLSGDNLSETNEDILYYSGKIENNYLKFKNSEKLFRIIRTVEDNNVKIVDTNTYESGLYQKDVLETKIYWGDKYRFDYPGNYTLSVTYYNSSILENSTQLTSWNDSTKIFFTSSDYGWTTSIDNPIYNNIYINLMNLYETSYKNIINDYIVDFQWCDTNYDSATISDISFKCKDKLNITSKIGLLNLGEYEALGFNYPYDSCSYYFFEDYSVGGHYKNGFCYSFLTTSEITMNLKDGIIRADQKRVDGIYYFSNLSPLLLRPAFVIKGSSIILSGDGTKTNPYVVE